ncbi:D-alanine--D-alanine ligase [Ruminococcaceae bacterium OttesenSCG-928-A16]|nr:D-alanine--D-alanine ligase [Ruminococcaceae bacterium OttesenSCG-928-A16]
MEKQRIAILFGGNSSEYEVSCLSGAAVAEGLAELGHTVHKIGITKAGRWFLYTGQTENMRDGSWEQDPTCLPAFISPDTGTHGIVCNRGGKLETIELDVVFPVLHGRNGEDGTVQGLLELAEIPYVGCGVLASAMCMDKAAANTVFDAEGIPHAPWLALTRRQTEDFAAVLRTVKEKLHYPIFVKPAVGGSSVGITKVKTDKELQEALALAALHDDKIVFEQGISGQEVECAVLGNQTLFSSLPGEIESCNEVYDYEAKYQSGGASKLFLPAKLPQHKLEEVRDLALRAYAALGCTGLSRVDFFVEHGTEKVMISEINTLPGFTSISMYAKLMEMSGVTFAELLTKLLALALERANR